MSTQNLRVHLVKMMMMMLLLLDEVCSRSIRDFFSMFLFQESLVFRRKTSGGGRRRANGAGKVKDIERNGDIRVRRSVLR